VHLKNPFLILISFLILSSFGLPNNKDKERTHDEYITEFILEYMCIKYPEQDLESFIYVGVNRQKMYYFENGELIKEYDVSTSKHGAGEVAGSERTPTGLHIIKDKYGAGVPWGGVFKSRRFTGKIADIVTEEKDIEEDAITSRVFTLKGTEYGINKGGEVDSYQRRIYIHGTAEEGLIGQPASHGCIRMLNDDVIELFEIVKKGTPLIILDN